MVDQFEMKNFDSLKRKILTVWKGKFWQLKNENFWQFEKENFDSFEKENFDSLKRKILHSDGISSRTLQPLEILAWSLVWW
jgi:hypothetical protein